MATTSPANSASSPSNGGGISTAGKLGIIATVALVLGGIIYYFTKSSVPAVSSVPTIPATTSTTPATPSAIDAQDAATTQQMVAAVQGSQFSSALPYIYAALPLYMQGGANNTGGSYGTITINGQQVTPMSSAFTSAMWNAWASSVISNINAANAGAAPTPVAGKTQAQANAAFALLQQVAALWGNYKQQKASSLLGLSI